MKTTLRYVSVLLLLFTTYLSADTSWTTGEYDKNEHLEQTLTVPNAEKLIVTLKGETEEWTNIVWFVDENGNTIPVTLKKTGRTGKWLSGIFDETFTVEGSSITAHLRSSVKSGKSGITVTVRSAAGEEETNPTEEAIVYTLENELTPNHSSFYDVVLYKKIGNVKKKLKEIFLGGFQKQFIVYDTITIDNTLYILFTYHNDNAFGGVDLWKSDGTIDGTVPVKIDLYGYNDIKAEFVKHNNGKLYFKFHESTDIIGGTDLGIRLWETDGTEEGTHFSGSLAEKPVENHPEILEEIVGGSLIGDAQGLRKGNNYYNTHNYKAPTFTLHLTHVLSANGQAYRYAWYAFEAKEDSTEFSFLAPKSGGAWIGIYKDGALVANKWTAADTTGEFKVDLPKGTYQFLINTSGDDIANVNCRIY